MTDITRPEPLAPLAEDWQTALAVVAHPDDMEFGAAAAVARWTEQGKTVVYCMVTDGEAGIDGLEPEECRTVRRAEQIESARVVGVPVVEFLGLTDGILEYGVPLRRVIAGQIRRHQPDIVVTNNFHDSWGGDALNQADHIAVGKATLDAVRDAANRWIFHEQVEAGLEPWRGVQQVWAAGSPQARHGVDITESFNAGVASLTAHKAYIDGLGWEHFDPEEFLDAGARRRQPHGGHARHSVRGFRHRLAAVRRLRKSTLTSALSAQLPLQAGLSQGKQRRRRLSQRPE